MIDHLLAAAGIVLGFLNLIIVLRVKNAITEAQLGDAQLENKILSVVNGKYVRSERFNDLDGEIKRLRDWRHDTKDEIAERVASAYLQGVRAAESRNK